MATMKQIVFSVHGIRNLYYQFFSNPDDDGKGTGGKAKVKGKPADNPATTCLQPPQRLRICLNVFGKEFVQEFDAGAFTIQTDFRYVHEIESLTEFCDFALSKSVVVALSDVDGESAKLIGSSLLNLAPIIEENQLAIDGWRSIQYQDGVQEMTSATIEESPGVLVDKEGLPAASVHISAASPTSLIDWQQSNILSVAIQNLSMNGVKYRRDGTGTLNESIDVEVSVPPIRSTTSYPAQWRRTLTMDEANDHGGPIISLQHRWYLSPENVAAFHQMIVDGIAPDVKILLIYSQTHLGEDAVAVGEPSVGRYEFSISSRMFLHPISHLSTTAIFATKECAGATLDVEIRIANRLLPPALPTPADLIEGDEQKRIWVENEAIALNNVTATIDKSKKILSTQELNTRVFDELKREFDGPIRQLSAAVLHEDKEAVRDRAELVSTLDRLVHSRCDERFMAISPRRRLDLARDAQRHRCYQRAGCLLERAVAELGVNTPWSAYRDLAICRLIEGRVLAASVMVDRAISATDQVPNELWLMKTATAMEYGNHIDAERSLTQIPIDDPLRPVFKLLMDFMDQPYSLKEEIHSVLRRELANGQSPTGDSLTRAAQSLLDWSLPRLSLILLDNFISPCIPTEVLRAQVLFSLGHREMAIAILDALPEDGVVLGILGEMRSINGDIPGAIQAYGKAVNDLAGLVRFGEILHGVGEPLRALQVLRQALQVNGAMVSAWIGCARVYGSLGDRYVRNGEYCLAAAIAIDPDNPEAWKQLIDLYELVGDHELFQISREIYSEIIEFG